MFKINENSTLDKKLKKISTKIALDDRSERIREISKMVSLRCRDYTGHLELTIMQSLKLKINEYLKTKIPDNYIKYGETESDRILKRPVKFSKTSVSYQT